MKYIVIPPAQNLTGYVRFFWVLEGNQTEKTYVHRSMANSCTELLFHYKGTFSERDKSNNESPSFLSGIHSHTYKYRRFITNESFGIFGAYLYPFAARQLLNLSPVELANEMPDLHSALGNTGNELEEKIILLTTILNATVFSQHFLKNG